LIVFLYFVKMNKFVVVAVIALAACAFADKFKPKEFACSTHILTKTSTGGFTFDGDMYIIMKDKELYVRINSPVMIFNNTVVLRCDLKAENGTCFQVSNILNSCTEDYAEPTFQFAEEFEYDTKESADCPDGTKCDKYCVNVEKTCYYADKNNRIVKTESIGSDFTIAMEYKEESFPMDIFVFDMCNKTKLPAPASNPCGDISSSSHNSSSSSQGSNSSLNKVSFVAVLAALLVVLL